jgi:hypothetical protein
MALAEQSSADREIGLERPTLFHPSENMLRPGSCAGAASLDPLQRLTLPPRSPFGPIQGAESLVDQRLGPGIVNGLPRSKPAAALAIASSSEAKRPAATCAFSQFLLD